MARKHLKECLYSDRAGRRWPENCNALLIAVLAAAVCGMLYAPPAGAEETAVVVTDRLNVRPDPGTDQEPVAVLGRGTRVRVLGRANGWLHIGFDDRSGYVRHRSRYIQVLSEGEQDSPAAAPDQVREKAEAIAEKIEKSEAALAEASRREKTVIGRLDEVERALHQARSQSIRLGRERDALTQKIDENQRQVQSLQEEISRLEVAAAGRLEAYYKLQWLGSINLLASADSLGELVHRKTALETIMASDEALWDRLSSRRRRLESTQAELYVQKKKQMEVEAALEDRIADMKREKRQREEILSRIQKDKTLQLAAIHSLKDAAAELERVLRGLRERSPEGKQPPLDGKALTELKGLLPLPVRGKIVSRFGKYRNPSFNVVNFRSGIDIRADRGEPIHAVSAGTVLYAEWFKGYGNMIIIDHGSFYYTLYAHAEELFKQKGEGVDPGEVIATVGDTGSMIGPSLYFEIRHHGKPLDPADWLKQG